MSLSTCRVKSDSIQKNHVLVVLGKKDEKGWGVGVCGGGGRGMRGSQVENKCDFSSHCKEAMSLAR